MTLRQLSPVRLSLRAVTIALLALIAIPAVAQRSSPSYVDACLDEPTKERPNMDAVEDECRLAGKYLVKNNNIGNASWVFLLSHQWDKAMALSYAREGLDGNSVLYMNQGHIAAMRGDYDEAKRLYQQHISANTRPMGEGFDDDLNNILPRIFPDHDEQLDKAKAIWADLYASVAAVDQKHNDMSAMLDMGDLRSAQSLMEEAQAVKRQAMLERSRGYIAGQMYLADLAEVNGRFKKANDINEAILSDARSMDTSAEVKQWYLGQANRSLGRLALRDRDFERAYGYFSRSEELIADSPFFLDEAQRWDNPYALAATLSAQGKEAAALKALQETISAIRDDQRIKTGERTIIEVRFRQSEANLLARQGELLQATSLLDALISEQMDANPEPSAPLAISYLSLAKIYAKQGDWDKADHHYQLAVEVASVSNPDSFFTQRMVISYIYFLKQIGDHDKVRQLMEGYQIDPEFFAGMDLIL